MGKVFSGSAVPRETVFILADGTFVVQWDEKQVQDLLSGQYRQFADEQYGHAITDYELNQLKSAGRVEHYNRHFVWLFALPEVGRFAHAGREHKTSDQRIRVYYLNTTLPHTQLEQVRQVLSDTGLDEHFLARSRGDLVAVLGRNGMPFRHLKEAERAQKQLQSLAPDTFRHTAIAFIETVNNNGRTYQPPQAEHTGETLDLTTIIRSQTDTSVTAGKRVLLITNHDEERNAIHDLLSQMKMDVADAVTGEDALLLVEDSPHDLLLMDLVLPDMHGWELLAKIREISSLNDLPVIVIADHGVSPDNQAFALTVVRVAAYLVKPVSMAQLRQNVWVTLNANA